MLMRFLFIGFLSVFLVTVNYSQEDWTSLVASDGFYSLRFPTDFDQRKDTVLTDLGIVFTHNFYCKRKSVWYHLIDIHYPYDVYGGSLEMNCDSLLFELIHSIADREKSDVLYLNKKVTDWCASNARLIKDNGEGHIRLRSWSLKDRTIILKVTGDEHAVNEQQCDIFFDGFRILDVD